jgi:hypothetical protein
MHTCMYVCICMLPPHVWSGKPNGATDRRLVGLRNYQEVPPILNIFRLLRRNAIFD